MDIIEIINTQIDELMLALTRVRANIQELTESEKAIANHIAAHKSTLVRLERKEKVKDSGKLDNKADNK